MCRKLLAPPSSRLAKVFFRGRLLGKAPVRPRTRICSGRRRLTKLKMRGQVQGEGGKASPFLFSSLSSIHPPWHRDCELTSFLYHHDPEFIKSPLTVEVSVFEKVLRYLSIKSVPVVILSSRWFNCASRNSPNTTRRSRLWCKTRHL